MTARELECALQGSDFLPGLMLPAWFVADEQLKVRKANAPMRKLLGLTPGAALPEGLDANSFDADGSIWRLVLVEDTYNKSAISEVLSVARQFREMISRSRSLDEAWFALTHFSHSYRPKCASTRIYVHPYERVDGDFYLLPCGIRVFGAPGLLALDSATTGDDGADFGHIQLAVAFRIAWDSRDTTNQRGKWYGIQPALHQAQPQVDAARAIADEEARLVAIKFTSGSSHDLRSGLDRIGESLVAATAGLMVADKYLAWAGREQAERELLMNDVVVDSCSRAGLDPSLLSISIACARTTSLLAPQKQFCDVLGLVGDSFRLTDQARDEDLTLIYVGSSYDFWLHLNAIAERCLDLLASTSLNGMPLPEIQCTTFPSVEGFDVDLRVIEFIIRELIKNASAAASGKKIWELSANLIEEDGVMCLKVTLRNDLSIRSLAIATSCPMCTKENISMIASWQWKHEEWCNRCLEHAVRDQMGQIARFGKSSRKGGGKGGYMLSLIASRLLHGRLLNAHEATKGFRPDQPYVEMGIVAPLRENGPLRVNRK